MHPVLILLSLFVLISACAEEKTAVPELNPSFVRPLLEAAAKYAEWQKADVHFRVAPTACAAFADSRPAVSASTDLKTHGKKLYYLFLKEPGAYRELATRQPVGQTLVKESWIPSPGAPMKQAELFIMLKLDPKTGGTDEGWVYGTLSPDGKTVTAAGRLASCMKCHEEAKQDRVFGWPKDPKYGSKP